MKTFHFAKLPFPGYLRKVHHVKVWRLKIIRPVGHGDFLNARVTIRSFTVLEYVLQGSGSMWNSYPTGITTNLSNGVKVVFRGVDPQVLLNLEQRTCERSKVDVSFVTLI